FSDFAFGDIDNPLPVTLASFTSNLNGRNVKLYWVTSMEQNNAGFDIERKSAVGSWAKIGFVQGKGTVSTPSNYLFEDRNLNAGKYNYRLKQIDANGNFAYHNLITVLEVGQPTKFDLSQNYPNPFNPTTKIDFQLPTDGKVSIRVYDMSGREVKTLLNNEQRSAGYYTLDFNGSSIASGTYFYRFIAESNSKQIVMTKKMVLVK
ncbi:MAG: T9SS type A sorting domain-containing protein, partial [Ignavibacteriae bacterium]|nr:T9SS type A sorting domain-containing protein [Ignavibacteriota bacterium]